MQVFFRTDASLQIGSGHVMRCLTLADALKAKGADCHFMTRAHQGHLIETIRQRGFVTSPLPSSQTECNDTSHVGNPDRGELHHAAWLGCDWQTDATQSVALLSAATADWVVVDHYSLDARWEKAVKSYCYKLMVIDDLADRPHHCDVLVDQNLGHCPQDYATWVPSTCQVLAGPEYALLRPEFPALRDYSLKRRTDPQTQQLNQILITMGGVDFPNATSKVLEALKHCPLPEECCISVVMGANAPWLAEVHEIAAHMPWNTTVVCNINDMAQRMADSDLAIGAAGGSSWERCCLGLPTLMVVLAENQWSGARALDTSQAAKLIGKVDDIASSLPLAVTGLTTGTQLLDMSKAASKIATGRGVRNVLQAMDLLND